MGSGLDADADARCFYFLLLAGTVVSLIVIFFTLQVSRSILDRPAVRPLTDAALRVAFAFAPGQFPKGGFFIDWWGNNVFRNSASRSPFPIPTFPRSRVHGDDGLMMGRNSGRLG